MTSIRSIRKRGQKRVQHQLAWRRFNRACSAFELQLERLGEKITQAFVAIFGRPCKPDGSMSVPLTGDGSGQRLPEIHP